MYPCRQEHNTVAPFMIKHCPPFEQIFEEHDVIPVPVFAVVVIVVVVWTVETIGGNKISQSVPWKKISSSLGFIKIDNGDLPVNSDKQLHIMSRPFSIKHCPPFLQIFEPDEHWTSVGAAVVVWNVVVAITDEVSQRVPFK